MSFLFPLFILEPPPKVSVISGFTWRFPRKCRGTPEHLRPTTADSADLAVGAWEMPGAVRVVARGFRDWVGVWVVEGGDVVGVRRGCGG